MPAVVEEEEVPGETALATRDEPELRTRFEMQLALPRDEALARLTAHPDVKWSPDGNPAPFPDATEPAFQAWPADPTRDATDLVFVRRATAAHEVSSPYVELRLESIGESTRLVGRFLKHPPRTRKAERTIKFLLWLTLGVSIAYVLVYGWVALFQAAIWVGVIGPVVLLGTMNNRPTAKSMEAHGHDLWSLVGHLFVPYALGEGDQADPFREKQLGP